MRTSELIDGWLASKKPEVAFRTFESYSAIVRLYLRPSFGSLEVARLTRADIRTAMNGWVEQKAP